jgi:protein TonB
VTERQPAAALALGLALLLHAGLLFGLRIPTMSPDADPHRSIMVRLTPIAERTAAPSAEVEPSSASASTAAFRPAPAETATPAKPVPRVEPEQTPVTRIDAAAPRAADTPPVEETAEPATPATIAAAAVTAAAPAARPTLTDQSTRPAEQARSDYRDALAAWLRQHKNYPMHLRRRGVDGSGALRLRVDRAGSVQLALMETGTGDSRLDDITLDMVRRAEPFPQMPDALEGQNFECVIDIRYRIED